jgi:hypothetical protein
MVVAFLPFAISVLAGMLRSGLGQRTAVVFYAIAFGVTALTVNAVWQDACRHIGWSTKPSTLPARQRSADASGSP